MLKCSFTNLPGYALGLIAYCLFPIYGASADESLHLETFKTHSRLVFPVDESVVSEIRPSKTGFALLLKGVGFGEMGAPLGQEAH